jgi:hypothetical protein
MYLFHDTTEKSLKSILNDGYIKSLSLLQKEGYDTKPNYSGSLYKTNTFIYFNCIDKINSRVIFGECSFRIKFLNHFFIEKMI